ncbi:hypothetical protein WJX74_003586 [Apatococcus lobatus]|uniref:DUF1295 domain-containing protein n=1 Tax=Apatococcus lobatus TaxID=904363 RepID=A0AAW1S9E5_9CHLO
MRSLGQLWTRANVARVHILQGSLVTVQTGLTRCKLSRSPRLLSRIPPVRQSASRRSSLIPRATAGSDHMQTESPQVREPGTAWAPAGVILTIGTALPAMAAVHCSAEVAAASLGSRALLVLAEDAFFMLCATVFLLTGERFGGQRHPQAIPYPGPFTEVNSERIPPAYFKKYVLIWPVVLGMGAPIAAIIWLTFTGQSALAASTMGCYLLTLVAQQLSEGWFVKRRSPMWGQIPHTYQIYRLWQLARGCWLTSLAAGPLWLFLLQEVLILLWVFNFGAVMTWTPWLYRWHMQPQQSKAE